MSGSELAREGNVFVLRLGAGPAQKLGIVDDAVTEAEVLPRATALADKDRKTLAALKRSLYAEALRVLAAAG